MSAIPYSKGNIHNARWPKQYLCEDNRQMINPRSRLSSHSKKF